MQNIEEKSVELMVFLWKVGAAKVGAEMLADMSAVLGTSEGRRVLEGLSGGRSLLARRVTLPLMLLGALAGARQNEGSRVLSAGFVAVVAGLAVYPSVKGAEILINILRNMSK